MMYGTYSAESKNLFSSVVDPDPDPAFQGIRIQSGSRVLTFDDQKLKKKIQLDQKLQFTDGSWPP
jgi:hypothetical protein